MSRASARTTARWCLEHGYQPTPLRAKSKKPILENWPNRTLSEEEINRVFPRGCNVGVLTGQQSSDLVDIDLDNRWAVAAANELLPETGLVAGRKKAPRSHPFYTCPGVKTEKFFGEDSEKPIVELRSTGCQTVLPPSRHPSGDVYEWGEWGEPAEIEARELRESVALTAAAALLAEKYPKKGKRHEFVMALAGFLARRNLHSETIADLIRVAAKVARDRELKDRLKAVETTIEKLEQGEEVSGYPRLVEVIGEAEASLVCDRLTAWLPLEEGKEITIEDDDDDESESDEGWPEPSPEMFYGLAGQVAELFDPATEADRVAVLLQFLAGFGNVVDRLPHFCVEGDRHCANLFVVLVGESAKSRKGTSWGRVLSLLQRAAPEWEAERVQSGLSSGEGLIWAIRDPIIRYKDEEEQVVDPGVDDKRLLVVESEFGNVLRVLRREGNTLSPKLRDAWDGRALVSLTKHSTARATAAHVSVVAHVTADELREQMDRVEMANGYGNRILWACVRRSKVLPEGGSVDQLTFDEIANRVSSALAKAASTERLERTPEARELWREIYADLSEGRPGMWGACVSRAEAQAVRLSLIFALLDESSAIEPQHLIAAMAILKYVEESARWIFSLTTGNSVADNVFQVLRAVGQPLTKTQLWDALNRHCTGRQLETALGLLTKQKKIVLDPVVDRRRGGRVTNAWKADPAKCANSH